MYRRTVRIVSLLLLLFAAIVLVSVLVTSGPVRVQYRTQTTLAGHSPLWTAIQDDRPLNEVEAILAAQPDLLHQRTGGALPIHDAVMYERRDLARLLLERGADVNARIEENWSGAGNTPIIYAVNNDDVEMVRLLVEAEADTDVVDQWGESLMTTARKRDLEILQILKEAQQKNGGGAKGGAGRP